MTNNYPTPSQSVASADILSDPGSSDPASQQAWRIRGQGFPDPSTGNGWSTLAPQYTQGAEFDVSTPGFSRIKFSFDWQPTNRGVADIEVQYNTNIANPLSWVNAGMFSNTIPGGVWNNNNVVDLSNIAGVNNDEAFGVRIVSAYHPGTNTYYDTTGSVLNNSSGNFRLDNVTITSVPEPSGFVLAGTSAALLALLARRRRGETSAG